MCTGTCYPQLPYSLGTKVPIHTAWWHPAQSVFQWSNTNKNYSETFVSPTINVTSALRATPSLSSDKPGVFTGAQASLLDALAAPDTN